MPEHIGVILDGNRRWAVERSISSLAAHQFGADKIVDLLEWCLEIDIETITLYAFSTENFHRSRKEVRKIMNLLNTKLNQILTDETIHKNRVRIKAIGRINLLPESSQNLIRKVEEATKNYDKYYLNIALAYGGREEIIDAIQKIATDVKEKRLDISSITESTVSSYLYTNGLPDPDLILRTSGEERISNFLLWQIAYSEFYFSDVYWPAFEKKDFLNAIETYQQRKRRFGE